MSLEIHLDDSRNDIDDSRNDIDDMSTKIEQCQCHNVCGDNATTWDMFSCCDTSGSVILTVIAESNNKH